MPSTERLIGLALAVTLATTVALSASQASPEPSERSQAPNTAVRASEASESVLADLRPAPAPAPPPTTAAAPTTTTAAPKRSPTPPPPHQQPAASSGDPYNDASWDRLAQCESGGDWTADTANGYYGGIQFSLSTWQSVGGSGYPHEASREEQIARGKALWERSGWASWPGCTRSFGWR